MERTVYIQHTAEVKIGNYSVASSKSNCMAIAIMDTTGAVSNMFGVAKSGCLGYNLVENDITIKKGAKIFRAANTERQCLVELCKEMCYGIEGLGAAGVVSSSGVFVRMRPEGVRGAISSLRRAFAGGKAFEAWTTVGNKVFGLPITHSPLYFYSRPLRMDPNDYSWFQYLKAWWYRAPLIDSGFIPTFLSYMEASGGDFELSFCCAYSKMRGVGSYYAISPISEISVPMLSSAFQLCSYNGAKKTAFINDVVRKTVLWSKGERLALPWHIAGDIANSLRSDILSTGKKVVNAAYISALKVLIEMRSGRFDKVSDTIKPVFVDKKNTFVPASVSFKNSGNYRLADSLLCVINSAIDGEFYDRGVFVLEDNFNNPDFIEAVRLPPDETIKVLANKPCSYKFEGSCRKMRAQAQAH